MISKLMILACALALSAGAYNGPLAGGQPAAQFPAGIDPKACPNFPDCSSPLVAISQAASLPGVQHDPLQQYGHYQQQPAQQAARQYAPQQYNPVPQQYNPAPQQYNPAPQQYNAVPQQYNPVPQQQYNVPQYNPQPQQPQRVAQPAQPQYPPEIQNALDRGEYIGDGDYHGEGLAEAMAVGHINQQAARTYNPAPVQYQQPQPAQHYASLPPYREQRQSANQLPAGVDGSSCPNYPFCGQ